MDPLGHNIYASAHNEAHPVSPGAQRLTAGTSIFCTVKDTRVAAAAGDTKLAGWPTSAVVVAFLIRGGHLDLSLLPSVKLMKDLVWFILWRLGYQ